jgi:hypothetical protein
MRRVEARREAQLACPFCPLYAPQASGMDILKGPPWPIESVRVDNRLHLGEH